MKLSDGSKLGLVAAVIGASLYATGISLENETLRQIMDYVVGAEYIEPLAAKQGYVSMMKLAGGAAVAGGLVGIVCNGMMGIFGDGKKNEEEQSKNPAPCDQTDDNGQNT